MSAFRGQSLRIPYIPLYGSLCAARPILRSRLFYMNSHIQVYVGVQNHTKRTRIRPTLLHNVLYNGRYQYSDRLPSSLHHTIYIAIGSAARSSLTRYHKLHHRVVSCKISASSFAQTKACATSKYKLFKPCSLAQQPPEHLLALMSELLRMFWK